MKDAQGPVRVKRVQSGTNMNFGRRKLAGSKNIILNTCTQTYHVVSKAHWRRDNLISLRNQNHFGANTNGLSFLLKQFIK